jgi:hypothetical protein
MQYSKNPYLQFHLWADIMNTKPGKILNRGNLTLILTNYLGPKSWTLNLG